MFVLYRFLLRLYPGVYFREYAGEMTRVFSQGWDAARGRGLWNRAQFCSREISGAILGALRQRWNASLWSSFGRFDMKKQFRFPRTAIFLMLALLADVIFAIDKTRRFASNPVGDPDIVGAFLAALFVPAYLLVAILGTLGFAILFGLKRSGMHRLSNIHTRARR